MEFGQFSKIQQWFESLDQKVEEIREQMVTKPVFENRLQALLTSMTNLHNRVMEYKNQQDQEIALLKRALHDLEEEVKQLRRSVNN